MKKSRKLFLALAAVAAACVAVAGLAACDEDGAASHEHTLIAHSAQAATCEAAGNAAYWECSECHKYFKDADASEEYAENAWTIAATGHSYAWTVSPIPTKTDGGSATGTCTQCEAGANGHEKTVPLPALTDGGYTVTDDTATCTAAGEGTYTVTAEGYEISFEAATEQKEHSLSETAAREATCETAGNKTYWECSECHKHFKDADASEEYDGNTWSIAATGHSYAWTVSPIPTKTDGGSATGTCTQCEAGTNGHEKTVLLPVLTDGGYTVADDTATCTAAGEGTYTITVEGYEISFEAATEQKEHSLTATPAQKESCETDGNAAYWECSECHKHFKNAEATEEFSENGWVIAKHHTYQWTETQAPTATAAGSAKAECSACGEDNIATATLPALTADSVAEGSYTYNEVPATCENDGEGNYTTTDALTAGGSLTFHTAIPAIGHQWVCSDAPDALGAGGSVSATCANGACGETRQFPYTGTLAQTGTQNAPVSIESSGQYYLKRVAGTDAMYFTIPIEKAGKYHVDFINLDTGSDSTRRPIWVGTTFIMVKDSATTVVAGARGAVPFHATGTNANVLTGEMVKPSYNADTKEVRWFEVQADKALQGGSILFCITANGSEEKAHPFILAVEMQEAKYLQEGDNSIEITEAGERVDEYLFESAEGGWYEISIDEANKAAAGALMVYLNGVDTPVLDTANALSAKFEMEATTNRLVFMANNRGTYTVKLEKTEKPTPTLKVGVAYDGDTSLSDSTGKQFSMIVDESVEEGEYTLVIPFTSNRAYARNSVSPFTVSVNGGAPIAIAMNFNGAGRFNATINVKGGDVLTIKSTALTTGALNDIQLIQA